MTCSRLSITVICLGVLYACDANNPDTPGPQNETLRVVTRNAPTTYFINQDQEAAGPEHDLITAFAESQGRTVEFKLVDTISDVLDHLAEGRADLAAAGLSLTDERQSRFLFSHSYRRIHQQVVCRRTGQKAHKPEQLEDVSLAVITGSSYEHQLEKLRRTRFPQLQWDSRPDVDSEHLLYQVWKKQIDCTVADSNIVAINRRFMPELLVMFNLAEDDVLVWAMPKQASGLKRSVDRWLASADGQNALRQIENRYYSFIDTFDFVDTRALIRRIDRRLPKYRKLFEEAAAQQNLSATLLMAQSYQESHWNPKASSPTGVKGIMMLTRNTARSLGVKNRLVPAKAIPAGATYLAKMRERFSEDIPEPDRTYLALAAYNIGRAHMHDAQTLARQLGKDPDRWAEMKTVLPLLAEKRYYKNLKYGYARGLEPVRYVRRIRNYQTIIEAKLGD